MTADNNDDKRRVCTWIYDMGFVPSTEIFRTTLIAPKYEEIQLLFNLKAA